MMTIGHCQIEVRRTTPHPPRRHRRPRLAGVLAVASVLALVALAAQAVPAGANSSVTGTVTIAVRSVSVTGGPVNYDQCFSDLIQTDPEPGLITPNGFCNVGSSTVAVTNGPVPDWIEVSSTPFEPLTPATGPAWSLCETPYATPAGAPTPPGLPECTGPLGSDYGNGAQPLPGADEAAAVLVGAHQTPGNLGSEPVCDTSLNNAPCSGGNLVPAGATASGYGIGIVGPQSITSPSSSFANTITWVAVPPS